MKHVYLSLTLALATIGASSAQEASYEHPTALRYIGTIQNPNPQPVCSFTTRNPVNNGAFMWAPVGSTVKYTDTSSTSPAPLSWNWATTGGVLENAATQDAMINYPEVGTYNFPTLTVTYPDEVSIAAPDEKLKIGGVAELCLADCREWLTTYALGVNYYDNQLGSVSGCLGGTNKLNIVGVGNLYMMSVEDGFLDGVNVYFQAKPSKWKEGAKVGIRVWMANITQYDVQLAAIPLEGDEIKFEDLKTAEDDAWVPIAGGAVAQMKCSQPIDLFGKPFIFIDVYGWSQDPSTEDLQMLMDVMPNQQMQPEDASNMLAHNSFVRLQGESDYLRPVSYFGGNYGSFMICPIIRGGETPFGASVDIVQSENDLPLDCKVEQGAVTLSGTDGSFSIFNMSGQLCTNGIITGGSCTIPAGCLAAGLYVARNASGQVARFAIR